MDGKSPSGTGARKQDHLDLCLDGDVSFRRGNGLDRFDLVHDALPELHLDEIDTSAEFLGHSLKLPLMISSMTGGSDEADVGSVKVGQDASFTVSAYPSRKYPARITRVAFGSTRTCTRASRSAASARSSAGRICAGASTLSAWPSTISTIFS